MRIFCTKNQCFLSNKIVKKKQKTVLTMPILSYFDIFLDPEKNVKKLIGAFSKKVEKIHFIWGKFCLPPYG